MLLESERSRVLFDYGMSPKDPPEYPEKCPAIDACFLSHAHLDHSGMIPWIAAEHEVPIHATSVTHPLAEMLAVDSLKIAKLEGYPQPYQREDVSTMMGLFEGFEHGERRSVGDLDVRYHSAGHIPGSTMFEVSDGSETLLFTGDLNLIDTRLVRKAEPVRCDTLVIEATYSGRQHPERKWVEEQFLANVEQVVDSGGTAIVPSFAVGRTQEILMVLAGHGYDVWLDGMGKHVTRHMLEDPQWLRSAKDMSRAFEPVKVVKTPHQRDRAAEHAEVIVTTSGMLEGGPVVQYLDRLRNDPASAVFFTGFQVPGSGGRTLMDEGTFEFGGVKERVALKQRYFNFSAHAGHDDLVRFAQACRPERVVLFHSDNRGPLAEALRADGMDVHLLQTGQELELA